jgi:hypothetical protein
MRLRGHSGQNSAIQRFDVGGRDKIAFLLTGGLQIIRIGVRRRKTYLHLLPLETHRINPRKNPQMKTKSSFFHSIGAFLALLVFVALPNSLAAPCQTCCAPACSFYFGTPNYLVLETTYPSNAWIFYTITVGQPNTTDPTHDANGNPTGPTLKVPNGTHIPLAQGETHIRMLAWRSDRGDSPITTCSQQNPPP